MAVIAAKTIELMRVHQVIASRETGNLSLSALELQKQCLDHALVMGASALCCSVVPLAGGLWSGLGSAFLFSLELHVTVYCGNPSVAWLWMVLPYFLQGQEYCK